MVPVAPPLSMLGPRALLHGHHDFQGHLHVPSSSTGAATWDVLTPPVLLFTAVRKENCLPLKMLLVKMWRRALRQQRRSLRAPGPPAVAQSRGNSPLPQICPGPTPAVAVVSRELGGKLASRAGERGDGRGPYRCPQAFRDFLSTGAFFQATSRQGP